MKCLVVSLSQIRENRGAQGRATPGDQELLDEFRRVPDEWKREVIRQVEMFNRLASRPPNSVLGQEQPHETQQTS